MAHVGPPQAWLGCQRCCSPCAACRQEVAQANAKQVGPGRHRSRSSDTSQQRQEPSSRRRAGEVWWRQEVGCARPRHPKQPCIFPVVALPSEALPSDHQATRHGRASHGLLWAVQSRAPGGQMRDQNSLSTHCQRLGCSSTHKLLLRAFARVGRQPQPVGPPPSQDRPPGVQAGRHSRCSRQQPHQPQHLAPRSSLGPGTGAIGQLSVLSISAAMSKRPGEVNGVAPPLAKLPRLDAQPGVPGAVAAAGVVKKPGAELPGVAGVPLARLMCADYVRLPPPVLLCSGPAPECSPGGLCLRMRAAFKCRQLMHQHCPRPACMLAIPLPRAPSRRMAMHACLPGTAGSSCCCSH